MDSLIEFLLTSISFILLFLIPAIPLAILYIIKSNKLRIGVNCWFCNTWTRVYYSQRNNFHCPVCLQYNGFDENGGYNKVIEAQFDISSDNRYNMTTLKTDALPNRLCTYCNYNQEMKVRQLAHFVPMNEENYDVEVEHFQAQLEKTCKLCKRCDKVLKKTLDKQKAWGYLNSFEKIKINLSNCKKSERYVFAVSKLIRYLLILFSLIIFCQAIKARVVYSKTTINTYFSDVSVPYISLLNEWCHKIVNVESFVKTISVGHYISKVNSTILPIVGTTLEIILWIWDPQSVLWNGNKLLGWITLATISSNIFPKEYFVYINTIETICSFIIIYVLFRKESASVKLCEKKGDVFTQLKTRTNETNCFDPHEDTFDDIYNLTLSSKDSFSGKNLNTYDYRNNKQFHNSFITARNTKTSSVFNNSIKNTKYNSDKGLHCSLDNLHLSNLDFKLSHCVSPTPSASSINHPILSPPKLNITRNQWTAGGFWKNDIAAYQASAIANFNLSRSSSQSSGFVSNSAAPSTYNFLQKSRDSSPFEGFGTTSLTSEHAYYFTPIDHSRTNNLRNTSHTPTQCWVKASQLYNKCDNVKCYPILGQNNMLIIQDNISNFERSFSKLSLQN